MNKEKRKRKDESENALARTRVAHSFNRSFRQLGKSPL